MTDVQVSALAELETRAGASDENRSAWLAVRRTGITATEIRELYLRKLSKQKLIAQKLGRIPDDGDRASYAKVPAYGKQREPEIAAEVLARYGMVPESRVFHAKDDPRKLASPDGVGENFDGDLQIAEIKTHGTDQDVAPGGVEYVKKGYLAQKVWQMRVTGARRCLYATEERLPDGTWFRPGEQRFYWLNWTDEGVQELATKLEAIADDFLAALDAAAAESPVGPVIDEELDTLAVNYLRGLGEEKDGADLKKKSWDAILERIDAGEVVVQESPMARVSFSPAEYEERPLEVVDTAAAEAAAPELYARLELARAEAEAAQDAVGVEMAAVRMHEAKFTAVTGMERVRVKKEALRVTAGKQMKEAKE